MNERTAKELEHLRKKNGFTQSQLAEKLGISRQAVSKWENGEASPDTDHLIELSNLYNISIDEMLNPKSGQNDDKQAKRADFFGYDNFDRKMSENKKKGNLKANNFPFPVIVVIVYMLLGFYKNLWHPGWLIFMTIPIYYYIVSLFDKNKSHEDKVGRAMAPYSVIVVIVYFLIGYFYGIWHPTWLIFLTIPLFYFIVGMLIPPKEGEVRKFWMIFPYPLVVVGAYFLMGYFFNLWHPTWLIFMTIPIYYYFADRYYKTDEEKTEKGWKAFPYPVFVAAVYLIMGFFFNLWHPGWLIFLTIPIWAFFIDKNKNKHDDDNME